MDVNRSIEMYVNALDGEQQELRGKFLAELAKLGDEAKSAAQHAAGPLPTLAWLEMSMARLRELRDAFDKAESGRYILRRLSEAFGFGAQQKKEE
jgi:hypothetical protein